MVLCVFGYIILHKHVFYSFDLEITLSNWRDNQTLILQIVVTVERVAPVVEPDKPSELCSIISNTIEVDSFSEVFHAHKESCMITLLTLNSNEDDTDGVRKET